MFVGIMRLLDVNTPLTRSSLNYLLSMLFHFLMEKCCQKCIFVLCFKELYSVDNFIAFVISLILVCVCLHL